MTWGGDPQGHGCTVPMALAGLAIALGLVGLAVLVAMGLVRGLDGWDGWTP